MAARPASIASVLGRERSNLCHDWLAPGRDRASPPAFLRILRSDLATVFAPSAMRCARKSIGGVTTFVSVTDVASFARLSRPVRVRV